MVNGVSKVEAEVSRVSADVVVLSCEGGSTGYTVVIDCRAKLRLFNSDPSSFICKPTLETALPGGAKGARTTIDRLCRLDLD